MQNIIAECIAWFQILILELNFAGNRYEMHRLHQILFLREETGDRADLSPN